MRTPVLFTMISALGVPICADTVILPKKLQLWGPNSSQQLVVQEREGAHYFGQHADEAIDWKSCDPEVVRIEHGVVFPVGNGQTEIYAHVESQSASAEVHVMAMHQPHEWGFRRHVVPLLSRMGCNSGACHGALAGKGEFKLSLRGYDPMADYFSITRQARGRRIELSDPGRSMILTKPTTTLPHKGGLRMEVGAQEYQVLSEWIAAGAKPPRDDDAVLERVEVLPHTMLLKAGDHLQLVVRAHYSDGRQADVTRWGKFSSANETVAQVDERGRVNVLESGEGAIVAWFSSQLVFSRVIVPFGYQVDTDAYQSEPQRNFIDQLVLEKLRQLNLEPSPMATDEEFLRRVHLDTIGALPHPDDTRAFLVDASHDKRDRLIERLLHRPEFVDYWAYKWSDVLSVSGRRLPSNAVKSYYEWIRSQIANNTPWNEVVRAIITAKGHDVTNGATNFYTLHKTPETMAENVCQAFLSLSINCAKCHNHPLEKWTNDQYYAMANLFARVRVKGREKIPRRPQTERCIWFAMGN